jgi:multidrug efflux pump subunit AcrB
VADQSSVVPRRDRRVHDLAVAGDRDHHGGERAEPRLRAGAIVALSIPLTLAIVFPAMQFVSIDLQRISLGALIIALTLLVDDAMSTIDAMTTRLAQGDAKEQAATFAYKTLAFPC